MSKDVKKILFLIIIVIVIMVLLGIYMYNIPNKPNQIDSFEIENEKVFLNSNLYYINESDKYIIYDNTGLVRGVVDTEDSLNFYKEHPDLGDNHGIQQIITNENDEEYENN